MAKNFIEDQVLRKKIIDSLSNCDTFLIISVKNDFHEIYMDSDKETDVAISGIAGTMLSSIESIEEKKNTITLSLGAILIIVFGQAIRTWNGKIRKLTRSVINITN
jgi:hypothetical protein